MNDLISIIVPVYNSEKYLSECLDSIVNQTHKNLQIILVDDCSTDDSAKICEEYAAKDLRIEVYRPKQNGGQSASRNLGLKHAKGEWIAFADNDDTLELEMLETLLANAKEHDVKVSGCGNKRIENGNVKICNLGGIDNGIYNTEKIIEDILINPRDTWVEIWSKLYHKSLLPKLQFPEGCQLEDYMVNLPLLFEVKKVYFDNEPLYNWIIRHSSQSSQQYFDNRKTYFEVSEKLRRWFEDNTSNKQIIYAAYVWEYGVKAKLLEDMCLTKNKELINLAKEKLEDVKKLKKYARNSNKFKLKSRVHVSLRLLRVRLS